MYTYRFFLSFFCVCYREFHEQMKEVIIFWRVFLGSQDCQALLAYMSLIPAHRNQRQIFVSSRPARASSLVRPCLNDKRQADNGNF